MAGKLSCEAVARIGLGEPVERRGDELIYRCNHPERHKNGDAHPSLMINPKKDLWGCFVCNVKGKGGWSLSAYLAGCDPGNKAAVTAWLREHGLTEPKKRVGGGALSPTAQLQHRNTTALR
jgi:hypothetical protein